jgi:hypothetical protein
MMKESEMKPGYRTTEFATVLASLVVTVLVLLGIVNDVDEAPLRDALGQIIMAVGTLLSNAAIIVAYIRSRTELKRGTSNEGL